MVIAKTREEVLVRIKNERVLAKWQRLLVFALIPVLPVSAVMVAVVLTKQIPSTQQSIEQQIDKNKHRMNETNRSAFDNLYKDNNTRLDRSSRTEQENICVDEMFELGYEVLTMFEQGMDEKVVFDYFFDSLQEEFQQGLAYVFENFAVEEQETQKDNEQISARGWHNTHIVISMTLGYLVGTIASYLIGIVAGGLLAAFALPLGPAGLVLISIAGYFIGSWIGGWFDDIIYRNKGIIYGFRYVLASFRVWWLWGSSDTDLNVLDLLKLIAGAVGGNIGNGTRPAGVAAPSFA